MKINNKSFYEPMIKLIIINYKYNHLHMIYASQYNYYYINLLNK
jgi:hypothetical protein